MTKSELLNNLGITVNSLKKIGKATIINDKYVMKEKTRKSNFYDYLITRNFNFFPFMYSTNDDEVDLMEYIEEKTAPKEQKLEDIIYLASILHLSTSFLKNIDIDKIKEIYETTIDKLNSIGAYYQDIQNVIEEEIYMSPADYLLIRNISLVYKAISLSREFIDKWYREVEKTKSIRYAFIHGNLEKNHLLEGDKLYLISWDHATIDFPIRDIETFYKNSHLDINLLDILSIYETKFPLKKEEKYLLFSILLIPDKIDLNKDEYGKIKQVSNLVLYLEKTLDYLENYSKKTNDNTHE